MLVNSQRFAIDWKRMDDNGRFYEGDRTKNESYVDYDTSIYAVADGAVVSTLDKLDPGTPGVLRATDPVLAPQITLQTVDGNNIAEDLGGGVYGFSAHLKKGSLLVKPGDRVTEAQLIAKFGNTGNSSVSHLHLHLVIHRPICTSTKCDIGCTRIPTPTVLTHAEPFDPTRSCRTSLPSTEDVD